jgi:N-acetylmuramoyl-L-alanine amidase
MNSGLVGILLALLVFNKEHPEGPPKLSLNPHEIDCMADNVYHEARGEGLEGMHAVTQVVLNRAKSSRWGGPICSVIYQRAQFSWTLGRHRPVPPGEARAHARLVAGWALASFYGGSHRNANDVTGGAVFYHSIKISPPEWTKGLVKTTVIGNHVFYKEPRSGTRM